MPKAIDNPAAPSGKYSKRQVNLANLGSPTGAKKTFEAVIAAKDLAFNIQKALDFLTACETCTPRVTYKLGAKCKFNAVPGRDFTAIDCSGFVRECVRRGTNLGDTFPDGSVNQHDWVKAQGFATDTINGGMQQDGAVRIAFLPPTPTREIGHVVLIHNGKTLESHSKVGPDSRDWDGTGWQAETVVYVLHAAQASLPAPMAAVANNFMDRLIATLKKAQDPGKDKFFFPDGIKQLDVQLHIGGSDTLVGIQISINGKSISD